MYPCLRIYVSLTASLSDGISSFPYLCPWTNLGRVPTWHFFHILLHTWTPYANSKINSGTPAPIPTMCTGFPFGCNIYLPQHPCPPWPHQYFWINFLHSALVYVHHLYLIHMLFLVLFNLLLHSKDVIFKYFINPLVRFLLHHINIPSLRCSIT